MSQCAGCHAGCCRSFAVPVTGADILRIERERGCGFWDFVCRWEDRERRITKGVVPQFHFADEPETPFAICLLQEPSRYFPPSAKCRFLVEEAPDADHPLGRAHCGIYESRPSACRVFPTRLSDSGALAVIYDVPERVRPVADGEIFRLCPQPWRPDDFDPIGTLQDLVVTQFEMQFFQQVAESWNAVVGPWAVFPEFLRLVYQQRVVRPAGEQLAADVPTVTLPTAVAAADNSADAEAA